MKDYRLSVRIYGSRGSVPVEGKEFEEFGGATSCVCIKAAGQEIYLDAGSGIVGAVPEQDTNLSILLTHPHLDHMIGLPFFTGLSEKDRPIGLYLKKRKGLGIQDILRYLYTPPLWPVGIFDYPAAITPNGIPDEFMLGDVKIESIEGNHPGGVSIFKITYEDVSVVYATDVEYDDFRTEALVHFAKGATLLIFDGQYTPNEEEQCRGYGHSTSKEGVDVAREAGVKQLVITHHAPEHNDEMLRAMENEAREWFPDLSYARCGQEIFF